MGNRIIPLKNSTITPATLVRLFIGVFCSFLALGSPSVARCETRLTAVKTEKIPVIDGYDKELAWENAPEVITRDTIAGIDVAIKAVFTEKEIFFRVRFPDPDESRLHKAWVWNQESKMYESGPLREDCFVFKWAMDWGTTNLSIESNENYTADIWFWKANRTDPAGFADDKYQLFSSNGISGANKVVTRSGKQMFLKRKGDAGNPAYGNSILLDYAGETLPQFVPQTPTGSRADIRAKGVWSNGEWCLEFGRKLVTGNADDVQFEPGKEYLFGISRYEIAGRKPEANSSQPLFGTGDVSEKLILGFAK